MSFGPPPGTSAYNWFRQMQMKSVANVAGLQSQNLKASDPTKICGRMLDTSVVVGATGIPITSDYIDPSMIQGHAFVAPAFAVDTGGANLLLNPTAMFEYIGWNKFDLQNPITYALNGNSFWLSYFGSSPAQSGIDQIISGFTQNVPMTYSGMIEIDTISTGGVFVDIIAPGIPGVLATQEYTSVTSGAIPFSLTFTSPINPTIQVRFRMDNSGTGQISTYLSNVKLEYGSVATPFIQGAYNAVTEIDISGALHSVLVSIGIENIPNNTVQSNGEAAVAILWYYKNTNSAMWIPWAESSIPGLPYPLIAQVLTFGYGQLALGINYDFGCAFVDLQGNTGAIGMFVQNWSPATNEFTINSSYMLTFGGNFTPALSGAATMGTPLSVNGLSSSVSMAFTIINQPIDGSLSRIGLWFRNTPITGSGTSDAVDPYTFYASIPATNVGLSLLNLSSNGAYSTVFTDLTNNVGYDFAISAEDSSGGETAKVYAGSITAQTLTLPPTSLPSVPPGTVISVTNATSVATSATQGQTSYYTKVSFDITLTDGTLGPSVNPAGWLEQINILAKPVTTTTPDGDPVATDFTIVNTIYTSEIANPISIIVGPFPGGSNQEFGVQLVDQAGNASSSDTFILQPPPNVPAFDSNGNLEYSSYGTAITQVITNGNGLQAGVVGPQAMANPALGANLLFNPSGYYGLSNGWLQDQGLSGLCNFATDQFGGGRFRMYYYGGGPMDAAIRQNIANLFSDLTMTMSGYLEIDVSSDTGKTYAGWDIVDGSNGNVIANYYDYGVHGPEFFQFTFTVPTNADANLIYVRMRAGNAGNGGNIDAYFYKLKLEHGTPASPYSDDMSTAAVTNTHTAAGDVVIASSTVSGGYIDYGATPQSIQAVINNQYSSYNAGAALALANGGSTVPYSINDSAYKYAVGTGGQVQNGQYKVAPVPTGSTAGIITSDFFFLNNAGTYQIMISFSAIGSNASYIFSVFESDFFGDLLFVSPSGYSNAINLGTTITTSGTQNIATNASCQVSGQQWISARLTLNSGSITTAGMATIQAIQIA